MGLPSNMNGQVKQFRRRLFVASARRAKGLARSTRDGGASLNSIRLTRCHLRDRHQQGGLLPHTLRSGPRLLDIQAAHGSIPRHRRNPTPQAEEDGGAVSTGHHIYG
jgi:hypothetical protein